MHSEDISKDVLQRPTTHRGNDHARKQPGPTHRYRTFDPVNFGSFGCGGLRHASGVPLVASRRWLLCGDLDLQTALGRSLDRRHLDSLRYAGYRVHHLPQGLSAAFTGLPGDSGRSH